MARISGLFFDDNDANGIFNSFKDNTPANKKVELLDGNNNVVATTTTDGDGRYEFNDIAAGDYQVQFFLSGDAVFSPKDVGNNESIDSDVNPETGRTDLISLSDGENRDDINSGCYKLSRIGDRVFEDTNGNGIQDEGEPGVANVVVELQTREGEVLDTVGTNNNGEYEFLRVPAGDYKVKFVEPNGFDGFTIKNVGGENVDSDANSNGVTDVFGIPFGANKTDIDAGLIKTTPKGSIGDFVFNDLDSDGFQDDGEPGVNNVTVRLQTPKSETIREVVTDSNGFYLFDNLDAGDYKITVVEPDGFDGFTIQNARGVDDTADSDVNPNTGMSPVIHLDPGEDNTTVDVGLVPEPEPEPEPEPARLGNFVFNDLDGDGFQENGEPGIPGVTVILQTPDGTEVSTTTTDNSGNYLFDNLDAGRYKITVVRPDGFEFTEQFATLNGNRQPAIDSNIAPASGMSNIINLNPGATNLTVDAGLIAEPEPEPNPATLGDRIFNDLDEDGIQDEGEPGVSGVVVTLQNPNGNTITTETTDSNGNYLFENLTPGDYKITVPIPDGFDGYSPQNVGSDDTIDSDLNPNTGMSNVVTLNPGDDNRTLDGGLTPEPEPEPEPELGRVGNFVFNDLNADGIQDDGEPGIPGATVILQTPDGTTIEETVTDGNGIYSFDNVTPGQYKVTFEQPNGFNSVSPFLVGSDRSVDSNANPRNGLMSPVFTLNPGQTNNSIDAGFFNEAPNVNPGVDLEKLVRVEGQGADPGVDLCDEFGNPVGLIFEYVGGSATNQTGQSGATITGSAINDPTVEVLSTIEVPGQPTPTVFVGGGKGKGGKGKGGSVVNGGNFFLDNNGSSPNNTGNLFFDDNGSPIGNTGNFFLDNNGSFIVDGSGKGKGKGGKGKGGIVNPGPIVNPNPNPAPLPSGTPVALGETFVVRPGSPTANIVLEGASGSQEIGYLADCSEPIQLGDTIGGLRLVGFEGTNGSTRLGGTSTDNLDADNAPGPNAVVGDNIVFTYVVNNTGDTPLGGVEVTDDRLNPTFVSGDNNGNGLIDFNEEWIYTASESASAGLQTNIGTVNALAIDANNSPIPVGDGSGNNISVSDSDAANYTGVVDVFNPIEIPNTEIEVVPPNPPIQGDLCDVLGKPIALTFLYEPSNAVNTAQEKFEFSGTADDDNIAFIAGGGKGKGGKSKGGVTGTAFGGQQVSSGETFTIGVDGSNTGITIFDDQGGPALQFIEYHTSCSDIIQLGDQIGSITLVGYNGENGSTELTEEQINNLS